MHCFLKKIITNAINYFNRLTALFKTKQIHFSKLFPFWKMFKLSMLLR